MAQSRSETLDSHWSSTRRTVEAGVIDEIFEDYGTVNEFRKSALQMVDGGGRGIETKIETGTNAAGSFDTYDVLGKAPINPFETAEFNRRYYYCPIILSDTESWENSGAEKVFDELQALGNNAMSSILKAINEDFYSAQVGKNILGFQDIIADATGTTVGGVASTTWDNQRFTTTKTFLTATTTNIFDGIDAWGDLLDACMIAKGKPTKLFTTWSIARAYRVALSSQGYARTELNNAQGVGGKSHPPYYNMDLVADNDCTALHCYMVDTKHIKLRVLRQANFKKTPFVTLQSNGQLAELSYLVAGVTLVPTSRRRHGVATTITGT